MAAKCCQCWGLVTISSDIVQLGMLCRSGQPTFWSNLVKPGSRAIWKPVWPGWGMFGHLLGTLGLPCFVLTCV